MNIKDEEESELNLSKSEIYIKDEEGSVLNLSISEMNIKDEEGSELNLSISKMNIKDEEGSELNLYVLRSHLRHMNQVNLLLSLILHSDKIFRCMGLKRDKFRNQGLSFEYLIC